MVKKIKKILIANRGEIAIRIMHSCKEMGIRTVAVFSEADRLSMHVRYADEARFIGPAPSNESYLCIEKILSTAKESKADAIHPGYGFLSENACFAEKCKKAGIIFIGPGSESIKKMGDKITARITMLEGGVPVVPGTEEAIEDEKEAVQLINKIGLPVMVKASAGGGGKGMRLIEKKENILSSLRAARSEAKAAFGNDSIYIEKYISSPHHIEFQILGDQHGNVIHLCERECSVQRRHQKVVEETPSPLVTPELRKQMGKKAVAAAKAINYVGAGTVEFLVDNDLNFYFLEMNTRLQVEHPITEMTTGYDLVRQQILIAEGREIQISQEDVKQNGHAIECRIYAEDPDNNFMPSPGKIEYISEPKGIGIRVDGYMYQGFSIPMEYDPLISKLVVWDISRKNAIKRMIRALKTYKITGVKNSIKFLGKIMQTPDFINGKYDTHFIDKNKKTLMSSSLNKNHKEQDIAIIAAVLEYQKNLKLPENNFSSQDSGKSQWKSRGRIESMRTNFAN